MQQQDKMSVEERAKTPPAEGSVDVDEVDENTKNSHPSTPKDDNVATAELQTEQVPHEIVLPVEMVDISEVTRAFDGEEAAKFIPVESQQCVQFRKRAWRRRILLDAHSVWKESRGQMSQYLNPSEIRRLRTNWARSTLEWVRRNMDEARATASCGFADDEEDDSTFRKLEADYQSYLKHCHAYAREMVQKKRSKLLKQARKCIQYAAQEA